MRHQSLHNLRLSIVGFIAVLGITLHVLADAPAPIYPAITAAKPDIAAALDGAAKQHKRVLLDFGGNWCGDCKALDVYFHKPENVALLQNFVVVHVNVGDAGIETNFDVADKYGIPLKKGVPALAVLDESGKVLYAQNNGEFEDMRHMDSASVNDFLTKWKP